MYSIVLVKPKNNANLNYERKTNKLLFKLAWGRSEESAALFACSTGWCETEQLLNVLSNGHGAQNVQEYKGAVGVVLA